MRERKKSKGVKIKERGGRQMERQKERKRSKWREKPRGERENIDKLKKGKVEK